MIVYVISTWNGPSAAAGPVRGTWQSSVDSIEMATVAALEAPLLPSYFDPPYQTKLRESCWRR